MKLFPSSLVDVHKSLKRHESAHFVLFVDDKRDGILVPHALDALEKTYEAIGAELGYFPKEKVRVEVAPDATSFNAISTLSLRDIEETGAVGICKFNKLMIISPRALSFGYRWVDSLSHEYLHYAIVALSTIKRRSGCTKAWRAFMKPAGVSRRRPRTRRGLSDTGQSDLAGASAGEKSIRRL